MEKKEKKENEKKIGLPNAPYLALGKSAVCRVSDLGHLAIPLTTSAIRVSKIELSYWPKLLSLDPSPLIPSLSLSPYPFLSPHLPRGKG